MPPIFTEPGWSMHSAKEMGIDDFQSNRSPDRMYRTTPLGGLFTRQLHLGAFLTEVDPNLRGIPTMHVEAACASGGAAVLAAAQQIMAGLHDVVLVAGVEQQKTMPPFGRTSILASHPLIPSG